MQIKSFEKMYLLQLQDLYSSAKQLKDALPKLIKTATSRELKSVLKEQCEKNKFDISKIEEILKQFKNFNPNAENCDIVEEFLEEADEWIEVTSSNSLIDAGLILLCKKITHYQMATCEYIVSCARVTGNEKEVDTLIACLKEWRQLNNRFDEIFENSAEVFIKP